MDLATLTIFARWRSTPASVVSVVLRGECFGTLATVVNVVLREWERECESGRETARVRGQSSFGF